MKDVEGNMLYRVAQKAGPTDHPRLQNVVNVEGGNFDGVRRNVCLCL
jgi:hypothetical protein